MAIIGPANSGTYSPADIERRRTLARMLMSNDYQAREPLGALAKALQGMQGGWEMHQADEAERYGRASADASYRKVLDIFNGNVDPMSTGGVVNDSFAAVGGATDPALQSYFSNVRSAESGGDSNARNPNSSATGDFQFIDSTWNGLMDSYPELRLTPDGRTDPDQQARAMRQFTADNSAALQGAGLEANPANLYAAHFLGAGGARNVLGQPDDARLASIVGGEVIEANPFLSDMSVGDFRAWAANKAGGPGATSPGKVSAPPNRNALVAELLQAGSNEFMNPNQSAVINMLLGRELTPPKATESYRTITDPADRMALGIPEDDRGVYQLDQNNQLHKVGGGGVNVNVGGDNAYDRTLSENLAKTYVGTQDASTNGLKTLTTLQVMEQALDDPNFYSGFGAQPALAVKRLVSNLGLDPSAATSMETFNALAKQSALDLMGGSLGAGFSNADRSFVTEQTAGLDASPEGNRALIELQRLLAERQIEIGKVANAYAQEHGGRLDQNWGSYLADWAEQNPLFPQTENDGGAGGPTLPDPMGIR